MKNKTLNILISIMLIVIASNFIFTFRIYKSFERTKAGLTIGGLALVENLQDLLLLKASLSEGKDIQVIEKKLTSKFYIYQSIYIDSNRTYMLVSKRSNDLVYLINRDTIIYYDKLVYDMNEKLKVGYRLKFDEWLFDGN